MKKNQDFSSAVEKLKNCNLSKREFRILFLDDKKIISAQHIAKSLGYSLDLEGTSIGNFFLLSLIEEGSKKREFENFWKRLILEICPTKRKRGPDVNLQIPVIHSNGEFVTLTLEISKRDEVYNIWEAKGSIKPEPLSRYRRFIFKTRILGKDDGYIDVQGPLYKSLLKEVKEANANFFYLTPRQLEIASFLCHGFSIKGIADRLRKVDGSKVSWQNVSTQVKYMKRKARKCDRTIKTLRDFTNFLKDGGELIFLLSI